MIKYGCISTAHLFLRDHWPVCYALNVNGQRTRVVALLLRSSSCFLFYSLSVKWRVKLVITEQLSYATLFLVREWSVIVRCIRSHQNSAAETVALSYVTTWWYACMQMGRGIGW